VLSCLADWLPPLGFGLCNVLLVNAFNAGAPNYVPLVVRLLPHLLAPSVHRGSLSLSLQLHPVIASGSMLSELAPHSLRMKRMIEYGI
jgi:hypothetical protein